MMNRLNLILLAATLVFGATTFHYARTWQRLQAPDSPVASSNPAGPAADPPEVLLPTPLPPREEAGAAAQDSTRRNPLSLALARHRLSQLRDPEQHARRARALIALMGNWEATAPYIGLTQAEVTRFLEEYAARSLQRQQRRLECQLDVACDLAALQRTYQGEAQRDQSELLGPERHARLKALQARSQDTYFAEQLNRRLPPSSALSGERLARLAQALDEERQLFAAEARQSGMQVQKFHSSTSLWLEAAGAPEAPGGYAQLRDSLTHFSQRLHGRAAGVLDGAQLALFKSSLELSLEERLAILRDEEAEYAIRREAIREASPQ
jgi:hypothetical protein